MGAAKAVLVDKFIVIQAFLKKQEKSQINNLVHCLKELEETKEDKTLSFPTEGKYRLIKKWTRKLLCHSV